jgi:hypothetical protein
MYVGDHEVKGREIITAVSIAAFLIIVGIMISGNIREYQLDQQEKYNKALKTEDAEIFQYGMRTSVGNAFVYGELEAMDTVTYLEIGNEYAYVRKVEKRYERYEEEITKEDEDGNQYTETRVYYQWDTEHTESKHCNEIKFAGVVFPFSKIDILSANHHIETINGDKVWSWKSGEYVKVKFEYYGVDTKLTGTIFTDLKDDTISDGSVFYNNQTIEEAIESFKSVDFVFIFWLFWIPFIIGAIFCFVMLENKWLDD